MKKKEHAVVCDGGSQKTQNKRRLEGQARNCEDLGHKLANQGRWHIDTRRRECVLGRQSSVLLVCVAAAK